MDQLSESLDVSNIPHQNVIKTPTHIDNTLDLILTTTPDLMCNIKTTPGLCKHDTVTAECDLKAKINNKKDRKVYIYRNVTMVQIRKNLEKLEKAS